MSESTLNKIIWSLFIFIVLPGTVIFGIWVFWAIASPQSVPECPELRLGVCREGEKH